MLASLLTAFASNEALHAARQARRAAIAYLAAALAALAGLGFLVGAAYVHAAERYGTVNAALAFAGGFFLLALLIVLIHKIASGTRARAIARQRPVELKTIGAAAALTVLPMLLRSKGGLATLFGPAVAMALYAIYRENFESDEKDRGPTDDETRR